MTTTGYAHPEMLVDTEWLASHLDDPDMVIVDCDLPTPITGRIFRER